MTLLLMTAPPMIIRSPGFKAIFKAMSNSLQFTDMLDCFP